MCIRDSSYTVVSTLSIIFFSVQLLFVMGLRFPAIWIFYYCILIHLVLFQFFKMVQSREERLRKKREPEKRRYERLKNDVEGRKYLKEKEKRQYALKKNNKVMCRSVILMTGPRGEKEKSGE